MNRAEGAAMARAAKAAKAPSLEERFWSKVDCRGLDECWPWNAAVRNKDEGYGAFYLEGRHRPATHAAWMLCNGALPPADMEVCHQCDNPACCNPKHLFLGTRKQNNDDKVAKGRQALGARVGTAKLTEAQAIEIKKMKPAHGRAPPGYRAEIAKRYGISPNTVTDVWSRRWTHLN